MRLHYGTIQEWKPSRRLKEWEVIEILEWCRKGVRTQDLSYEYGMSLTAIRSIRDGLSHRKVFDSCHGLAGWGIHSREAMERSADTFSCCYVAGFHHPDLYVHCPSTSHFKNFDRRDFSELCEQPDLGALKDSAFWELWHS